MPLARRNEQIREDWSTGSWSAEELAAFWDLSPKLVKSIIAGRVDKAQLVA